MIKKNLKRKKSRAQEDFLSQNEFDQFLSNYEQKYTNTFKEGGWTDQSKEALSENFGDANSAIGSIGQVASGAMGIVSTSMDLAKVKDTSDIENSISNVANTDYTQAMDNQQALDAYDSRAQSMEVGQLNKSGAEKASGVLGAVASGAGAGMVAGPWGALAGAVAGLGAGLAGMFVGDKRANAKEVSLNNQRQNADVLQHNAFSAQIGNIEQNKKRLALQNMAAYGGNFNVLGRGGSTHGGDWTNGLSFINNGATHEQNPNGGVQHSTDPEGTPNLVEEGEVVYKDYVFSNRIPIPEDLKMKYRLKDMSFADAVNKLQKESEERPNDPISKRGLEMQMAELQQVQEEERERIEAEKQAAIIDRMSPQQKAQVLQMAQQEQQNQEQQMMEQQAQQEQAMQEQQGGQGMSPEEQQMMQQQQMQEQQMQQQQIMQQQQGMQEQGIPQEGMQQPQMGMEEQGMYAFGGDLAALRFQGNRRPQRVSVAPYREFINAPQQYGFGGNLFAGGGQEEMDKNAALAAQRMSIINQLISENLTTGGTLTGKALADQDALVNERLSKLQAETSEAEGKKGYTIPKLNVDFKKVAEDIAKKKADEEKLKADNIIKEQAKAKAAAEAKENKPTVTTSKDADGNTVVTETKKDGSTKVVTTKPDGSTTTKTRTKRAGDATVTEKATEGKLDGNKDVNPIGTIAEPPIDYGKGVSGQTLKSAPKTANQWHDKIFTDNTYKTYSDPFNAWHKDWTPDAAFIAKADAEMIKQGFTKKQIAALLKEDPNLYKTLSHDGKVGNMHVLAAQEFDKYKTPEQKKQEDIYDETESSTDPNPTDTPKDIPSTELTQLKTTPRQTWSRYAPVVGSAIGMAMADKDYTNANSLNNFKASNIGFDPIGDYMTYNPMDTDYRRNQMAQDNAATNAYIQNQSGGNRATATAGMLASDYNNQLGQGELARQAEMDNFQREAMVKGFNRDTNQFNSDGAFKAASANQGQDALRWDQVQKSAGMRQDIDNQYKADLMGNLGNLATSLGDIGKENWMANRIDKSPAFSWTTDGQYKYGPNGEKVLLAPGENVPGTQQRAPGQQSGQQSARDQRRAYRQQNQQMADRTAQSNRQYEQQQVWNTLMGGFGGIPQGATSQYGHRAPETDADRQRREQQNAFSRQKRNDLDPFLNFALGGVVKKKRRKKK